jgi:hypothetical protein
MSINNRGFLILVLVALAFAFGISRRLQPVSTAETFETLTPRRGGSDAAVPPRPAAATGVTSAPIPQETGASEPRAVPEPEIVTAPEVDQLKKSVAAFTLQEFGKLISLDVRAPFSLEHADVNSIAGDILKFYGADEAGDQSLTVLMMKKRNASALASAYLADLDIAADKVRTESSEGILTAIVDDPEGAHIYAVGEASDRSFLIARTRKQPVFGPQDFAELKSLLKK